MLCLAATAAALRPRSASLASAALSRCQRTGTLLAQNGWTSATDPDGRVYYTNTQTGQSQWEPPPAATPAGFGAQVIWRVAPFNGVNSEFTVRNGEEQVLGRYDMTEPKTTVSHAQCVLRVGDDGTATLVSVGRCPTSVRPRNGAPCFGLERDYPHALRDFQYIGIDPNDPWGACYTCQVEKAGMGMDGYAQQGGWTAAVDEASGATYYYNGQTGQTQWDPP